MAPCFVYAWGCAGGLAAGAFVYVLPLLVRTALSDDPLPPSRVRMGFACGAVILIGAIAGTIALIPDDLTRGQAIALGLASQTVVKGLISGAMDALPPRLSRPPPFLS